MPLHRPTDTSTEGGELPAQVGHIADTGGHALADPRWHHMGGVPGEEDPADAPGTPAPARKTAQIL